MAGTGTVGRVDEAVGCTSTAENITGTPRIFEIVCN